MNFLGQVYISNQIYHVQGLHYPKGEKAPVNHICRQQVYTMSFNIRSQVTCGAVSSTPCSSRVHVQSGAPITVYPEFHKFSTCLNWLLQVLWCKQNNALHFIDQNMFQYIFPQTKGIQVKC